MIGELWAWLATAEHWRGSDGLPAQALLHLYYCVLAVLAASAIAIPLGVYLGHTGRGGVFVLGASNAIRALPTLGLVTLLVLVFGLETGPALAGLVVLAVPPILAGTHTGVSSTPADAVDAAKGMGMTPVQRLWQVRLPNAVPLVLGGIRSAMLQVVATAAVAAYVGLGGLGRLLLDGLKISDYAQMAAAAIAIAVLAVLLDLVLAGVTRLFVPRGLVVAARSTGRSGVLRTRRVRS